MRVSERLRSLVFIQKLFSKEFSSYPGELQGTGFHLQYNFGYGNLKCSRHKPLNLSTGFYSPGLAVLTLFRCCLQHLSLAFARCASGFVDSLFKYIWIYLNLFEYIWTRSSPISGTPHICFFFADDWRWYRKLWFNYFKHAYSTILKQQCLRLKFQKWWFNSANMRIWLLGRVAI